MKPTSRHKCIANMCAVNANLASTFASAANAMLELGLLQHNMKDICLLRTPPAEP